MSEHRRFVLLPVLLLCLLTGCARVKDGGETPAKIADHLYEAAYTEDFDQRESAAMDLSGFSCSAVQNGPYRGRNYDWTYADTDICVIHAGVTENRPHASVGISDLSFVLSEDGTYNFARAPFATVDGINDAGVCAQVNVMPYGENGALRHTETTEDDLFGALVVRTLLDNADSVEDALALLENRDIYTEVGTAEELHWMISGPASKTDSTIKTAVVEVFPDGLHITDEFVDGKPIMTNFNISNFDGTADSLGIGFGYERWQILNENFEQAGSVMGTFDLMEKVFFTKMYDLYGDRFWYSEYNGNNLSAYYDEETLQNRLGRETYDFYMENYGGVYYNAALWDGADALRGDTANAGLIAPVVEKVAQLYEAQNQEDGSLWITIHTAVYDLENRTLDLQVRESQDHLHFTIE